MLEELYPAYLLLGSIIGMYLAYLYGRKTKRFRWSEYVALLAAPVLGSLGLSYFYGIKIIYFFVESSIIGFIFEYGIGRAYHMTLNKRLWTYGKYSVEGYTSLLTFPLWGVGGIVFWLLAKTLGL